MSQSPTPIRRGADARDTEAFAKQIAASLLTQNDAPQPVSPVPETKKPLIEMHGAFLRRAAQKLRLPGSSGLGVTSVTSTCPLREQRSTTWRSRPVRLSSSKAV